MKIYGVALLAFCFLMGKLLGTLLGRLMQINSDLGGVGFAMLFLILTNAYLKKKGMDSYRNSKWYSFLEFNLYPNHRGNGCDSKC